MRFELERSDETLCLMDATVHGGNFFGTMMAVRGASESHDSAGRHCEEEEQQHSQHGEEEEEEVDDGEDGEVAFIADVLRDGAALAPQHAAALPKEATRSLFSDHTVRNSNHGGIAKKAVASRTFSSPSSRSGTSSSSQREQRAAYLQRMHLAHVTQKPEATKPPGQLTPPVETLLPPLLPQLAPPVIAPPLLHPDMTVCIAMNSERVHS